MASDSVVDQIDRELMVKSHEANTYSLKRMDSEVETESRDKVGEIADRIFLELDQNRDGFITLEEFRDGALKLPLVVSLLECFPDG